MFPAVPAQISPGQQFFSEAAYAIPVVTKIAKNLLRKRKISLTCLGFQHRIIYSMQATEVEHEIIPMEATLRPLFVRPDDDKLFDGAGD
jgi:hypothetical protein